MRQNGMKYITSFVVFIANEAFATVEGKEAY